jgi:glycosyltransferase involved in cell wall biosynthesis
MITYGHEKFIEEAINGVLMQECDFEYELIIANDCSPDNTDAVINKILKSHPKGNCIRYFKHEKNIGMMPNFIFALEQCKGNYIALCEGDDYWTDVLKLQKQVDYLTEFKNVVACFTDIAMLESDHLISKALKQKHRKNHDSVTVFQDLWIPTLTLLFRKESLHFPLPEQFSKVFNGDIFLFYLLAQEGRLDYLDFVSGVYRQHENGVWSGATFISQLDKRVITYKLLKDYFSLDKTVCRLLSERITLNQWSKIEYFYKQSEYKSLLIQYASFFVHHPFLGLKNGFLLIKQPVVKLLKR